MWLAISSWRPDWCSNPSGLGAGILKKKRAHVPKKRNLTICEYRHSRDDLTWKTFIFPETCSSMSWFSKKFSNLIYARVDRRLNKIELNYTHDFALFLDASKDISFSVKEVCRISKQQSYSIQIFILKLLVWNVWNTTSLISRCWGEKFRHAIFPFAFIVDFDSYVSLFSVPLATD